MILKYDDKCIDVWYWCVVFCKGWFRGGVNGVREKGFMN